jgi:hypothetical protein
MLVVEERGLKNIAIVVRDHQKRTRDAFDSR